MSLEKHSIHDINSSLTEVLVEEIAERNEFEPDDPDFCLYDETDLEALETFLERTAGPLTTTLRVFDTRVVIEKSPDGVVSVEVEPN